MNKETLGIAGLVVGVIGLVLGGIAFYKAHNAGSRADSAHIAAEKLRPSDEALADLAQKAAKAEFVVTRQELLKLVDEMKARIKLIEEEAARADILPQARKFAIGIGEESTQALFREVKGLQEEYRAGDAEHFKTINEFKEKINRELEDFRIMLKRRVDRWIESGVM